MDEVACSLSLRERVGVRGSWLQSGALPGQQETGLFQERLVLSPFEVSI